jgi:hypothetical protein
MSDIDDQITALGLNTILILSIRRINDTGSAIPDPKRSDLRLARSQVKNRRAHFLRRLIEITSRQQQTQRTLLDWLGVECPGNEERRRKNAEGW